MEARCTAGDALHPLRSRPSRGDVPGTFRIGAVPNTGVFCYARPMADVFVSYSHADRPRAAAIAGAVEESGFSLWWDEKLAPGCVYAQVIEGEIAGAGCVLVAWSRAARESLWVRAEANEALDGEKLVQLTLDGAKRPLPFNALPALDFGAWRDGRSGAPWPAAEARIGAMLRGETGSAASATGEPALQGFGRHAATGWAAICLVLLVAAAAGAAARGALDAAWFGFAAGCGLTAAAALLALAVWRSARVFKASRR